jgi:hypothetical protein
MRGLLPLGIAESVIYDMARFCGRSIRSRLDDLKREPTRFILHGVN